VHALTNGPYYGGGV
jgi:hypothetical protein